jgi:hypothetical protein
MLPQIGPIGPTRWKTPVCNLERSRCLRQAELASEVNLGDVAEDARVPNATIHRHQLLARRFAEQSSHANRSDRRLLAGEFLNETAGVEFDLCLVPEREKAPHPVD